MLACMGTVAPSPERAATDAATDAEAFEDWLVSDVSALGEARVLVVSPQPLDRRRIPASVGLTMLCSRRGERADTTRGADLGFGSGSFDAVYLCEMTGLAVDPRCLRRAHRALKPGGRVAVVVGPSEFSFAPLPAGGDARLLARILTDAGFCGIEIIRRTTRLIIAAAQRG
ncbi:MAG TPA: methyltransferase domain-containing protein [Casimicrobiaceae bacterium]|nr:methyltransferase domain-containing protein [Casimicrobiaceae bacterium]